MSTDRPGIPFRLDRNELARAGRMSIARAVTAMALAPSRRLSPADLLRKTWPADDGAAVVLKAAQSPTATANFPSQPIVTALRRLAPASVALRLFEQALQVDLTGLTSVKVPIVATPPTASFVGELSPAPMLQIGLATVEVGPAKKLVSQAALTGEIESASPEAASTIIGKVLGDATAKAVDTAAFDNAVGDTVRPPGLLHGVTPIASSTGTDVSAAAADIGNLVGAIADAGIDTAGVVIVANPREAVKLSMIAGPSFDMSVLGCASVPAKRVIAIAPAGLAVGYSGVPQVSASKEAEVHFETVPQPVPAPPTYSAFQSDLRRQTASRLVVVRGTRGA